MLLSKNSQKHKYHRTVISFILNKIVVWILDFFFLSGFLVLMFQVWGLGDEKGRRAGERGGRGGRDRGKRDRDRDRIRPEDRLERCVA